MLDDRPLVMGSMQLTTPTSFQMIADVEVKSLPCVFAYYRGNCDYCDKAKIELAAATNLPFRVVWIEGGPSWLEGWPMFWWHLSKDQPTQEDVKNTRQLAGWFGVDDLIGRWNRTRQVVAAGGLEGEAGPTPGREVERVIGLLPKPTVGFVDYGCGDARWCIAAAERWGCRVTGVEIDPARARAARERVASLGLSHLITIIEGDATTVDVAADVAVVYLYPETIEKLLPKLKTMKACASYIHEPVGLGATKNGNSWIYNRPTLQSRVVGSGRSAVWGGVQYSGPICSDRNCVMCNSIRRQLFGDR